MAATWQPSICASCGEDWHIGPSGVCAACEPPHGPTMRQVERRFRSRRQHLLMVADMRRDFLRHWPMRLLDLLESTGSGFLCGLLAGLAVVLYALEHLT